MWDGITIVPTFDEATHAWIEDEALRMSLEYPFVLPLILRRTRREVTLQSNHSMDRITVRIEKFGGGEVCYIEQRNHFEQVTGDVPKRHRFYPVQLKAA